MPSKRASSESVHIDYSNRPRHWHFEERISLDTIVAILGVATVVGGPVLIWGPPRWSRACKRSK